MSARRLASVLKDRGVPLAGFTTEEMRVAGRRVGFRVETITGETAVVIVDEIGKMELASAAFRNAVARLFDPNDPEDSTLLPPA